MIRFGPTSYLRKALLHGHRFAKVVISPPEHFVSCLACLHRVKIWQLSVLTSVLDPTNVNTGEGVTPRTRSWYQAWPWSRSARPHGGMLWQQRGK